MSLATWPRLCSSAGQAVGRNACKVHGSVQHWPPAVESGVATGQGRHAPPFFEVVPAAHALQTALVPSSVPAGHWAQGAPPTDVWPGAHGTHLPSLTTKPTAHGTHLPSPVSPAGHSADTHAQSAADASSEMDVPY